MTASFDTADLVGASLDRISLRGARIRSSDVSGVVMRGVDVDGLDIDSHDLALGRLVVNGVDVVPLVEAELDRRFPGRALRMAETPDGLREAWDAVRAAWAETVAATPRDVVDLHVPEEWSMAQTLRHLVLATDCWLNGAIRRQEQPFHEMGLVFDGAEEMGFDTSIFRVDTPTYDEVLAVRAQKQGQVTEFLATVTPQTLAEPRTDPWGGDWSPTVGDCLRVILDEEWAHLRYVRRDLAILRSQDG